MFVWIARKFVQRKMNWQRPDNKRDIYFYIQSKIIDICIYS
jgi:hypothetical protein